MPCLLLPPAPVPQLVPALDKWGGATVGLTLLAIGTMGMYETYFEQHAEEEAPAEQEATSDGSVGECGEGKGEKIWAACSCIPLCGGGRGRCFAVAAVGACAAVAGDDARGWLQQGLCVLRWQQGFSLHGKRLEGKAAAGLLQWPAG